MFYKFVNYFTACTNVVDVNFISNYRVNNNTVLIHIFSEYIIAPHVSIYFFVSLARNYVIASFNSL